LRLVALRSYPELVTGSPSLRFARLPGALLAFAALVGLFAAPVVALAFGGSSEARPCCCATKGPSPSCCCPLPSPCRTERSPSGENRTAIPETTVSVARSKESRTLAVSSPARPFVRDCEPVTVAAFGVGTGPPFVSSPLQLIRTLRI
jgi:hypothetical protein